MRSYQTSQIRKENTYELRIILDGVTCGFNLHRPLHTGPQGRLDEAGWKYKSNCLAGGVAIVLAVLVSYAYQILTESAFTDKMLVYLIALVLLSWLSAMVGYDKVVQAISQIRGKENGSW